MAPGYPPRCRPSDATSPMTASARRSSIATALDQRQRDQSLARHRLDLREVTGVGRLDHHAMVVLLDEAQRLREVVGRGHSQPALSARWVCSQRTPPSWSGPGHRRSQKVGRAET
jgi:hypothetical protein